MGMGSVGSNERVKTSENGSSSYCGFVRVASPGVWRWGHSAVRSHGPGRDEGQRRLPEELTFSGPSKSCSGRETTCVRTRVRAPMHLGGLRFLKANRDKD